MAAMLNSIVDSVNSALECARAALDSRRPTGGVDALVGLLTADVRLTTPSVPLEYHGFSAVEPCYRSVFRHRCYALVATRANSLVALDLTGERISAVTRFDNVVMTRVGLPHSLPV
ncbi:hypothetical protein [Mycolicibacterium chubuense]|nr:hypothetical protein [Mycolicibacterium chubuense]